MSSSENDQEESPSGEPYALKQFSGPESHIEEGVPDQYPANTKPSAGCAGGLKRFVMGTKPYVWIANGHSIPITVVVSKFLPNTVPTGFDVNAAAHGGGLGFTKEVWYSPATTKELQPNQEGVFPLWSRKNKYGVITIYKGIGSGKVKFIENDQIVAGSLVAFDGGPNLYVDVDRNTA